MAASGLIAVEGLNHTFGGKVNALEDVSFTVAPGEFVSIVGPSGCGKTTALNIVAGLVPLEHGTVTIDGATPRAGRHDVAYMLARDCLFPWLTALENAELGNAFRDMPKEERRAKAIQLLDSVGLRDFKNAYSKELSHGMRQRVALARTFSMPSPCLLMDEPFGALDAQTKLQLESLLLELWSRERRSVIFITHDLNEAVLMSDRVIVMSARPGRIVADIPIPLERPRSVRSLQKDPRFHELYAQIWEKLEYGVFDTNMAEQ
ncbi:ABC transporter ATP-binding protein [Oceanibacterium hippocampi]|uniref:Taurine import ATP-binding protein TauB n=1 Tax=Oceanibacterium hippocampi TaxID=745714 RepID=A0A1Y5TRQ1_9PROT|nr:ABC transporter ATP-binding protein [Oceanibacterium hippocampi]SLN66534.1 Taurine import ATP-binding protein TauB [Oceanibacterium hippocampi]